MHPIHLEYVKRHPFNDFAELFEVIDRLDPRKRDAAMLDMFCQFVKMQTDVRTFLSASREPWAGIWDDYANYKRFREACSDLPPNLNQSFMVFGIVSFTLSIRFGWAELDREKIVTALREYSAKMSDLLEKELPENLRETTQLSIESSEKRIANIDNEIQEAGELYAYISENLAGPLLQSWKRRLNVHE
jgi:hypothetical protein